MSGKACKRAKDETEHDKAVKNSEVLRFLGIADTFTELRIQRLNWIRDMLMYPQNYVQFRITLFGHFESFEAFESINGMHCDGRPR